jgi:hypothetical protein
MASQKITSKVGEGKTTSPSQRFRRSELVGKFPHIRHQPAPKARRKLTDEQLDLLVAAMRLI